MKIKFSTSWKGSRQKRKQVKYRANAPLHLKRKLLSSGLSKDLRKKYSRRSIPLRKGDIVKILIGKFKGKTGKVESLNLRSLKVYVEGIQTTKQDGNKAYIPLDSSNLQITELKLDDKKRIITIEKPVKKNIEQAKKTEVKDNTQKNKINVKTNK